MLSCRCSFRQFRYARITVIIEYYASFPIALIILIIRHLLTHGCAVLLEVAVRVYWNQPELLSLRIIDLR